ncbi:MAG: hypothetical protein JWR42_263 [Marmoricola sp.]|nr:hypothetical protein [Marmoricola sp.]
MDLVSRLTLLGGACDRSALQRHVAADDITRALEQGVLSEARRSRYVLATSPATIHQAAAVGGVLSHRSAAQHWGWAQRSVPVRPEVTVPRHVHVGAKARQHVLPHWVALDHSDVTGLVTTPHRTLVDCMRNLALTDSLPILDSALRAEDTTPEELVAWADGLLGRSRERARRAARLASELAANPMESTMRAVAVQVPGLTALPQHPVPVPGTDVVLHPDLADPVRRLAMECEGFEWHGESAALTRDCRRYNTLTLLGWTVVRFSWVLVMQDPAYVQKTLVAAVRLDQSRRLSA